MNMATGVYIARIADPQSRGILNKVRNTALALTRSGCPTTTAVFHDRWLRGSLLVARRVLTADEDLIVLRSDHHTMLIQFLPLVVARLRGKKIVVDIANPVRVAAHEVARSDAGVRALVKRFLLYLSFPLVLHPAHRILQYGEDGKWFTAGVRKKTHIVGNGVLVEAIPFRRRKPAFDGKHLHLIGVAHLAFWHGYDRLIRSIHHFESASARRGTFRFTIVGDGFERDRLEALVQELGLSGQVAFTGVQEGEALATLFEQAHIGVCSLATFRKNVASISDLKSKEYAARGVPFMMANDDADFPDTLPFVFRCPNDASIIDMEQLLAWYRALEASHDDFSALRRLAETSFDYEVKVRRDILPALSPVGAAAL